MAEPETIEALIRRLTGAFRSAGIEQPALDARLLVQAAMSLSAERLLIDASRCPTADEADRIATHAMRRLAREPVSRILGRRGFYGRDFEISPAVLDPRPETELLVERALDIVDRLAVRGGGHRPLTVLDVGTGSGAILVSLLAERPGIVGVGVDLSPDALVIARRNAERIGVLDRVDFLEMSADAIAPLQFDVLVANLPYIVSADIATLAPDVARFDPPLALDGGSDGLTVFALLFRALDESGWTGPVVLEVGAGQSTAVVQQAHRLWQASVRLRDHVALDLSGRDRCVIFEAHV